MSLSKKKNYGVYKHYSIVNKLRKEEKVDNTTLTNINNLALEDLIAIKLELSTRALSGKYFGIPIWNNVKHIIKEALLKTAISVCRTKNESAKFLGVDHSDFRKLVKKYNVESFFEEERNGGETVSTE